MEHAVTFMMGIGFLAIGLSYYFRMEDWISWLNRLQEQGRCAALNLGMLHILLGGLILGFHWRWQGPAMVLSTIGVLAVCEGLVYLLFPGSVPAILRWLAPYYRKILPISGGIITAIGLIALSEWWKFTHPDDVGWLSIWMQLS